MTSLPSVKRKVSSILDSSSDGCVFLQRSLQLVDTDDPQFSQTEVRISTESGRKSFESFYIERPRPEETHRPTPFQTRTFFPAKFNDGSTRVGFEAFFEQVYENGTYTIFQNLYVDPFLAFPFPSYDSPTGLNQVRELVLYPAPTPVVDNVLPWQSLPLVSSSDDPSWRPQALAISQMLLGPYVPSFDLPDISDTTYIDDLARSKAIQKIADGDVNIGVFLAELPQSWQWIATIITRLWRFVTAALRLDFKSALKALRYKPSRRQRKVLNQGLAGLDDFVLEFNYAFKPLLSDLYGFVEAFLSGLRTEGELIHVHAQEVQGANLEDLLRWRTEGGFVAPSELAVESTESAVSYDLAFVVTNPSLRSAQEMGLINPLDVVWEKIPFSFLIDWLFNFNSIVSSATAGCGIEFLYGNKTSYELKPLPVDPALPGYISSVAESIVGSGWDRVDIQPVYPASWGSLLLVNREVLLDFETNLNIDSLAIKLNPFTSNSRVANFLALLSKALRK